MAQQIINLGATPNDGFGTPLRNGGQIINSNFTELYESKVPLQLGHSGKFLSTNGTSMIWQAVTGANGGTVTSVSGIGNNGVSVSGSPITAAGSLSISLGDILPLSVSTEDITSSGILTFSGGGARIVGNLSNSNSSARLQIQTSITNGSSNLSIIPNGTSSAASLQVEDSSVTGNNAYFSLSTTTTDVRLVSSTRGTGVLKPITVQMDSKPAAIHITTDNNLILASNELTVAANTGFPYIPSVTGTPTGTPIGSVGHTPLVFDSTNNKLYFYNTAWVGIGATSGGTVTSVNITSAGTIVPSGGPVTSSGNINVDLAASGVTAGTYALANVTIDTYGRVTAASSAVSGKVTLVAGSATVAAASVLSTSLIMLSVLEKPPSSSIGQLYVDTITTGSGFTIKSSSADETVVAWLIIN